MIRRQRRSWAWFCLKWTEQTGLQALYHLTPAAALSLGNSSVLMVIVWGPGIHFSPRLQASGTWLQVRNFVFHFCCVVNLLCDCGKPQTVKMHVSLRLFPSQGYCCFPSPQGDKKQR